MIFQQIYAPMSTRVCPMNYIDIEFLFKDEYLQDALWVTEKMGLHKFMAIKQDYCPNLIQQFFATLEFDDRDNIGFTWMNNKVRKHSNFTHFGQILSYEFDGLHSPSGHRMHLDTSEYNKKKIAPLYIQGGNLGDTANLLPLYEILLCFFRANISPSGGNNDSIRGGIVHLLHYAHPIFEEGEECEGKELDVMHFIFSEMPLAMINRKIPPYAPYIMKLILDKGNMKAGRF
jgi:hypothetical protein